MQHRCLPYLQSTASLSAVTALSVAAHTLATVTTFVGVLIVEIAAAAADADVSTVGIARGSAGSIATAVAAVAANSGSGFGETTFTTEVCDRALVRVEAHCAAN